MKRFLVGAALLLTVAAAIVIWPRASRGARGFLSAPILVPVDGGGSDLLVVTSTVGRTSRLYGTALDGMRLSGELLPLFGPDSMEGWGACTAGDRIYFIGRIDDGQPAIFLAQRYVDGWEQLTQPVISAKEAGSLDAVAVTGDPQSSWRMWLARRAASGSEVICADSSDGVTWKVRSRAVMTTKARIYSFTVAAWAGEMRAWFVRDDGKGGRRLETVALDALGAPEESREPVAWQAPRDWRQGLPQTALPIIDASAQALPDDPRHIRLFITYLGEDGHNHITVAENFPVNGERRSDIFARLDTRPLL